MKNFYSAKKLLVFTALLTSMTLIHAQEVATREFQRAFQNADTYYYYDENYLKAASLYEPLLKEHPENYNLAAKLGICYLNLDGKNMEALNLLKKASQGVAPSEDEYKKTGEKAPLDTYLYLAIAYHRNDSLEKALSYFTDVKSKLPPSDTYQNNFVDLQIRNCKYAMEMKKKPLRIISDFFAPWLQEYPGASNPVLAKNDSVFVFTEKKEGITQIYCSYKNKTWSNPSNITKQLGGYDRLYSNSITGDGRMLILFLDDGGDGNLYYSTRSDTTWTKIRSVGRNINTIYWEAYGFITPDGKTMYFSSNRPEGEGELDIWSSKRLPDNSWDSPVNLGNVINTPYDETSPFYDPAENALLFSSIGHISMGGYDVFRSISRGGSWTQPVGMPYAFNTVQENTNFILNNNAPGFVASRFDEKTNSRNIFAIVAVDPADELTKASGSIKLEDGLAVDPDISLVTVKNLKTGEIMQNIRIAEDGSFNFDIKPGEYQVYVSHDGYNTDTINLSLPLYYSGNFLAVNPVLKPEKVSTGDFLSIKNVLFDFDKYNLNEEAILILQSLKNIMTTYPSVTIEVAGFTDSKGSNEYNRKLADKRAQAVIDYMVSLGMDASRFLKKAFGKSNFAAINSNPDGTDNPEGRKYNRRVTFGIVNPKTGIVLRQETFTPRHLRQASSMRFSIVLQRTKEKLSSDYFSKLIKDDMLFVRTIYSDTINLYVLGIFFNKQDATNYLEYVRSNGFKNAYLINQYDLENTPDQIMIYKPTSAKSVYTIQLKATKGPIDIKKVFPGYDGVREVISEDGFYKYYYGEFNTIGSAREVMDGVRKDFEDAFIKEVSVPNDK